jgi:hypothetical protein
MALERPSRQTLDGVPARVLTFLIGLGSSAPIRLALMARGYTQEDHDYAFSRLAKLGRITLPDQATAEAPVRKAVVEIDAWDDPHMAAIHAALERLHPDQDAFVFEHLSPSQGPAAVLGVETLLDRFEALESGKGRDEAKHKADLAAIATLEKRGYTKAERTRLRELVKSAKTVVQPVPLSEEESDQTLLELYGWLNDWATQAKTLLAKRSHLIRLGIAKPRKSKSDGAPTGTGTATPPTTLPGTPA